jgi:hypothetical protein
VLVVERFENKTGISSVRIQEGAMRGMRTMAAALLATWMLSGVVVEALAPLAVSERPSFAELSDLRGQSFKA